MYSQGEDEAQTQHCQLTHFAEEKEINSYKVLVTTIEAFSTHALTLIITAEWKGMGDVGLARYEPVQDNTYTMPDHKGFKLQ